MAVLITLLFVMANIVGRQDTRTPVIPPRVDPAVSQKPSNVDVPIAAFGVTVDLTKKTITFNLTNLSTKAITAWMVAGTVGDQVWGVGTDACRSFAGVVPNGNYILPGSTILFTYRFGFSVSETATATVRATSAVFEDRSAVGDLSAADWVFNRRKAALIADREMLNAFESAMAAGGVDLKTLEDLYTALGSLIRHNGTSEDSVREMERRNLKLAITDVEAGRSTALSKLEFFIDRYRGEVSALKAHVRDEEK